MMQPNNMKDDSQTPAETINQDNFENVVCSEGAD